jgi:hypothetical protein
VPVIAAGIVIVVIAMAACPVIGAGSIISAIVWPIVIPVRVIVSVRVIAIAVIARKPEPDAEVNLSIRTRRSREHKTPGHECHQQKFLHCFPPNH